MLPALRRRVLPSTLLVAGILGAGLITTGGSASAAYAPAATAATTAGTAVYATATTAAVAGPVVSTKVVKRAKVVVSKKLVPSTSRPGHYDVVVRMKVTSWVRALAGLSGKLAARTAWAIRSADGRVPWATSTVSSVARARAVAFAAAARLADRAARASATLAAVTTVRYAVAGTTAAAATVGAVSMPRGNLAGFKQVFADDFTTPAKRGSFLSVYRTKWSAYGPGWRDTSGHGVYDGNRTLSVANGNLDIYLHTVNGTHYVAAPTPKLPRMTYGRFSIRFQSDSIPGYKAAWMLWPNDDIWPAHGEIDFPEGDLNSTFSAFSHYATSSGGQAPFTLSANFRSWHTATIDWLPGKVVFYLDGRVVGTNTHLVPTTPMHWVLQTETALNAPAPSSSVSGHVRIAWVTAYAYAP
ncbi:MAG: family 16 glycosylhydrolase [Frankiales bacterium]|nr:family 16 glycosylhydrolase [Frankiales bacterium]